MYVTFLYLSNEYKKVSDLWNDFLLFSLNIEQLQWFNSPKPATGLIGGVPPRFSAAFNSGTSHEENSEMYSGRSAVWGRSLSSNTGLSPGMKVQRA